MSRLVTLYSPLQFAVIRILLGSYLLYYFIRLLPYGTVLFSREGMVSNVAENWTYAFSFWFVTYFTSPISVTLLLIFLAVVSLLFTFGIGRQIAALVLWLGWVILFNLNNTTNDPSLAFIGLLLLVYATVPRGEPLVMGKQFLLNESSWHMPAITYWGLWLIFAINFTASGLEKFSSYIWTSGDAIHYFLNSPIVLSNFITNWVITWHPLLLSLITWLVLYSQIFAVGFLLFRKTRIILWFVTISLFITALAILDLFEVLLGMIIFYLFLTESVWFQRKNTLVVWIDGTCTVCQYFARVIKNEDFKHKVTFHTFLDPSLTQHLSATEIAAVKEIIAYDGKTLYRGSDAVLRACTQLGGLWTCLYLIYLCPRSLRQYLYQKFSEQRYRFGICHDCQ